MNELTELWHALLCIANGNFIEMEGLAPSSEHSIDIHHSSFCQDVIITVGSGTAGGNLACNKALCPCASKCCEVLRRGPRMCAER